MHNSHDRHQQLKHSAAAGAQPDIPEQPTCTATAGNRDGTLWLDMNENPYGMFPVSARAIVTAAQGSHRYPREQRQVLRDLIARHEDVPPECILLGAGCTDIFSLACLLHGTYGNEVLVADPNYYLFDQYVTQLGGRLTRVPVDRHWRTDLDAMAARVTKNTDLVYVCNPNNPTGTLVEHARLRQLCEQLNEQTQTLVFIDEAYYELVEDSRRRSMVELVRDGGRLVVGRTFSKLFGLAGLRVGYGIGHPGIIADLRRVQLDLAPINELGIAAARAAHVDAEHIVLIRQRNAQVRAGFYGLLDRLGFTAIPGSQTNFVTFRAAGGERQLVAALRDQYNIRVHATRFLGSDWLRVSIGTEEQMRQLAIALRALS